MLYLIKYQSTPYNYTSPAMLKIEAASRPHAWAVAFDHLTGHGHVVDCTDFGIKKTLPNREDVAAVRACGVPDFNGNVHIKEMHEYQPKTSGKVVD